MNDLTHLVGMELSLDTEAVRIRELFLDRANELFVDDRGTLADLSQLATIVDEQSVGPLYGEFYALMDDEPFLACYRTIIEDVVSPLFDAPFRFQRKPGIRIHLPNVLTVQFHTDEWYGHGPDVVNFWMPLTDAFDSNTLLIASLEDSLEAVQRLEAEKATMATINSDLALITEPLQSGYGRLHVFNAKCVHGSQTNRTAQTRVSIDFRVLPQGADPGLKSIDEYYTQLETVRGEPACNSASAKDYRACSYLFGAHGFTRHIGTANQRLICADFAKKHDIVILAEETEIRTMQHHPSLLALAEGTGSHSFNTMLLFSVFCLPADPDDRLRIYRTAVERGVTMFFANERLRIDREQDVERVEQHWRKRVAAA
jgi:sporadic carbohydrate cluster protein (TIGR04323 family)